MARWVASSSPYIRVSVLTTFLLHSIVHGAPATMLLDGCYIGGAVTSVALVGEQIDMGRVVL